MYGLCRLRTVSQGIHHLHRYEQQILHQISKGGFSATQYGGQFGIICGLDCINFSLELATKCVFFQAQNVTKSTVAVLREKAPKNKIRNGKGGN